VLGWLTQAGVRHLHAHFGSNATTVALLTRTLGGPPFSFTVHGPEEFDKPLQLKLREKIDAAAFVVAITSFCRSQLFRWADLRNWPKIEVVHCAIDPRFEALEPPPPASSDQLVCVGRLCEQKGQLLLVEAVAAARRRGVGVRLLLAGDGEMRPEVEQAVERHGLADRVTITGWVSADEVREALDGSRALILPSFGEGLPVAIMEAMARHRPVITTYIAGIPELVRDGDDGLLVPAGDLDRLTGAIERIMAMNPAQIEVMGHSAATRVKERHSVAIEGAKLSRIIERSAEINASR
jgi:colanic acid/amylovoran biosynthesis glycosyltransferase